MVTSFSFLILLYPSHMKKYVSTCEGYLNFTIFPAFRQGEQQIIKEALIKSARTVSERFFVQSRYRKRRNTLCTRKGYAASVSQLALATAALYFPFPIPKSGRKRSAHSRRRFIQSFPYYSSENRALPFFFSHRYSRAHRIRFSPARQPMYPKKPSFHPGSAT